MGSRRIIQYKSEEIIHSGEIQDFREGKGIYVYIYI